MEDRKLLDTHLRVGQQETSNSIVTNIVVSWIFEIFLFTIIQILGVENHSFLTSFCRIKNNQSHRKKETEAKKEET